MKSSYLNAVKNFDYGEHLAFLKTAGRTGADQADSGDREAYYGGNP